MRETIMITLRLILGILAVSAGIAIGMICEQKEKSKKDKDKATEQAGLSMLFAIILVIAIGVLH